MALKRNITANYLGRAYSIGAIYLFVPFYISILGVGAYGLIAFYSVILAFTALVDVGLSTTFSREAAVGGDNIRLLDLLTTIERLLLLSSGAIAIALVAAADWIAAHWLNSGAAIANADVALCLRLMAISLPAQLLISFYSAGLLGLQRQVAANGVQAAYTTVRSGLVILPILLRPEPWVFFAWHLATTVVFALLARMALLGALNLPRMTAGRFAPSEMRPLLSFAGGMFAITIIASVNTQLDKLVVSKLFPIADFGYYTLAGTLAQLPVSATTPIAIALFPAITALIAGGDIAASKALYERYTSIIALLAGLGAFGLALFAQEIFTLWMAGKPVPDVAVDAARILAIGSLFLCLQLTVYYLSLANNDNWMIAALASATLLVSVPLVYFGARQLGLRGAALPWVALNAINFAMLSFAINRRYYPGSCALWLLKCVGLPVGIGAASMAIARVASNAFSAGTIAACTIAAGCGLIAIIGCWLLGDGGGSRMAPQSAP